MRKDIDIFLTIFKILLFIYDTFFFISFIKTKIFLKLKYCLGKFMNIIIKL